MKNGRVEFLGAKPVLIAVGERGKGIKKSGEVRHYERTVDFLARYNLPSDGSQVLLKPGTKQAFDHLELPYVDVPNHATIEVVPNKADQVDDRPLPKEAPAWNRAMAKAAWDDADRKIVPIPVQSGQPT